MEVGRIVFEDNIIKTVSELSAKSKESERDKKLLHLIKQLEKADSFKLQKYEDGSYFFEGSILSSSVNDITGLRV